MRFLRYRFPQKQVRPPEKEHTRAIRKACPCSAYALLLQQRWPAPGCPWAFTEEEPGSKMLLVRYTQTRRVPQAPYQVVNGLVAYTERNGARCCRLETGLQVDWSSERWVRQPGAPVSDGISVGVKELHQGQTSPDFF